VTSTCAFTLGSGRDHARVIPAGRSPRPAGLFAGGRTATLRIPGTVPQNAVVAVTIERAGGVNAPTMTPILSAPA